MPELKRSSSLRIRDNVYLGKGRAVTIRGYDTAGKFVYRLEISNAGVDVFAGGKGGKNIGGWTWEGLVEKLAE